jgi:hypothetical protein
MDTGLLWAQGCIYLMLLIGFFCGLYELCGGDGEDGRVREAVSVGSAAEARKSA